VAPVHCPSIRLVAGHGIHGDCHAGPRSPRQVLLTAAGSYKRLRIPPNGLRESILLDCERLDWASGAEVNIGERAKLRVTFRCEPCAKLNQFRTGLSHDAFGDRGVLARVVADGIVSLGDHVHVTSGMYPRISDNWQERVLAVLERMPADGWIELRTLAQYAGLHVSYCRTFPGLIKRSAPHFRALSGRVERVGANNARSLTCPQWAAENLFEDSATHDA
jgi:MOSC domain-containing protein YiiM